MRDSTPSSQVERTKADEARADACVEWVRHEEGNGVADDLAVAMRVGR